MVRASCCVAMLCPEEPVVQWTGVKNTFMLALTRVLIGTPSTHRKTTLWRHFEKRSDAIMCVILYNGERSDQL